MKSVATAVSHDTNNLVTRLNKVRQTVRTEYLRDGDAPWVIAYSGGKDSTLLLQIAWEILLELPPEERKRKLFVISNDTLVESPLVVKHMRKSMQKIDRTADQMSLPVETVITEPCVDQTFWVNVIGRGYIPPTRNFRWCTDRMKIQPANQFLQKLVHAHKNAVLLIGTRKSESQNRRRSMEKRNVKASETNPHDSINGCSVFAPLADLIDNEVWTILLQCKPPWGGTHRELVTLYKNAGGGECPLVLTKDDAPSCGTSSPRFGCWTCTVVTKDRSLLGLIDSGYEKLEILADFRDELIRFREDNNNRMTVRRDGSTKKRADGSHVYGPFKLEVRKSILEKLLSIQKKLGEQLISSFEQEIIHDIWRRDQALEQDRQTVLNQLNLVKVTA